MQKSRSLLVVIGHINQWEPKPFIVTAPSPLQKQVNKIYQSKKCLDQLQKYAENLNRISS